MSFLLQSPGMAHQACLSNSSHSHFHNVEARLQDAASVVPVKVCLIVYALLRWLEGPALLARGC